MFNRQMFLGERWNILSSFANLSNLADVPENAASPGKPFGAYIFYIQTFSIIVTHFQTKQKKNKS